MALERDGYPRRSAVRYVCELDGSTDKTVSQFTLYAKTAKGSKPDFHQAMPASSAQPFYNEFLEKLRSAYEPSRIKDGAFGAMMDVSLVNDGPVTIQLDSMEKRKAAENAQEGK